MVTTAISTGRRGARAMPERTCIVTREALPPTAMIRFAAGPGDEVVPDLKGTLPGRGAWVKGERALVDRAAAKGLFSRAFKRHIRADPALGALVDRLLAEAALGALGMARKAGQAIAGFTKVEVALRSGRVCALIHAGDAAEDGQRKLAAALRAGAGGAEVPVIREFTSEQLSLALGAANVIHAAVLSGGPGSAFAARAARLRRFRYGNEAILGGGAEMPAGNVGVA